MIKKIIGIIFFAVVVVIFTGVFFGKVLLASALSNVLGAPVKVGGLKLGAETGIYGLVIGNPKGFQEKTMISIPEASVQVDTGDLWKGRIHLQRVKLAMDEVTVEKSGGKINLLELKVMKKQEQPESAEPKEKPAPTEPSEQEKPSGKKPFAVQIDEVVLDLNKARYVDSGITPASVKEYDLNIRNESFKDVTNTAGLVKQIVFFILKKVGLSSLTANFDILMKGVGGEVSTAVGKLMDKLNNI